MPLYINSHEELRKLMLNHSEVVFKYRKLNGDITTRRGTLLPSITANTVKGIRTSSPNVFTYWDLDKSQWRCFKNEMLEWYEIPN